MSDNILDITSDDRLTSAAGGAGAFGPMVLGCDVDTADVYIESSGGDWFDVRVIAYTNDPDSIWTARNSSLVYSHESWSLHVPAPSFKMRHSYQNGAEIKVLIRVPDSSDIQAVMTSGSLDVDAEIYKLTARLVSGSVKVKQAQHADVAADSGTVTIHAGGAASVVALSGSVRLGHVRTADVAATSGDVRIDSVHTATVKAVTGSIRIAELSGSATARTVTGNVDVSSSALPGPTVEAESTTGRIRTHGTVLLSGDSR